MKLRLAILGFALAMWAAPAFGQGCAMCYMSALGATPKSQKALTKGVAVLLVPPVGMMSILIGAGFVYARKRDQRVAEDEAATVQDNQG
ncbi:MAG TPA: hypothetical protein VL177_02260 [Terriglobales bacterium]|jgi:hypothetical protein|nr:hypothetical protein [Terriglobales bacterium]